MSKIDDLKAEIARLSAEEAAELLRWLAEKDWNAWDRKIRADSDARRLDFLAQEAHEEKSKRNLKDF